MNKKMKFLSYIIILIIFFGVVKFGYSYLTEGYIENPNKISTENNKDTSKENKIKTLKNFSVYNEEREKVDIKDFLLGKPLIINFWASWCPPCKEEMPYFNDIKSVYGDKIQVLMVNLTDGQRETREKARAYIDEFGYDFNILYDEDLNAAETYALNQVPRTLFIDKEGNVIKDKIGMIRENELKDYVDKIVN
ncbi:TlpA disulfide reductase family protein [Clostridium sp.]|uniref:TlpA family protein disulfide reductase n=1 Tax=Clostridium sp. TaxID=1506 RepID=UPI00260A3282|nr:TlpA disulfide reductase family protein [Clostridium sp.]